MDKSIENTHEHKHNLPGEGLYFTIFIVLAILTLIELLVAYLPLVKVPLLLALALTKAWLVVQFYMHLRYDSKIFTWALLVPTAMAVVITILIQPLAIYVR
jgi:cytochrome c oxidase subunit IV